MNLSYKFFYWGPYLFQSTITAEFCQILLKAGAEARKKKRHYNHKLAGHIKNQFQLTHETLKNHLTDLLAAYIEGHKEFIYQNKIPEKTPVPSFTLQDMWINYQGPGEFNPPHYHGADLSFICFIDIPKKLMLEVKKFKEREGRSKGPGSVAWIYGEGGKEYNTLVAHFPKTLDFFMFPAALKHFVYPFKSKCERVSVSGNIVNKEYFDKVRD